MPRNRSPDINQQLQPTASSSPETDRAIQSARLEKFLAELAVRAVLNRRNRRRRKENDRDGNS
jgi:hypothetical protein